MTRPHERWSDALRTARHIIETEGTDFAREASSDDHGAAERACDRLALRIAEAIIEAERDAVERILPREELPPQPPFPMFVLGRSLMG